MKKLIVIIMLLPFMAISQNVTKTTTTVFEEWSRYLADCNELVADTIVQSGTVKCELVPVKMSGKIVSYNTVPTDTTWNECSCRNYKNDGAFNDSNIIKWAYGDGLVLTNTLTQYSSPEPAKNTFSIQRKKICMIKKRKASFEDFFERWCVEKGIVELN